MNIVRNTFIDIHYTDGEREKANKLAKRYEKRGYSRDDDTAITGRCIQLLRGLAQAQLDADLEDLRKLKAKLEAPCPHNPCMSNTPAGNALCPACWEAVWGKVLNGKLIAVSKIKDASEVTGIYDITGGEDPVEFIRRQR